MKAAIYSRYGGPEVISIADVPTPEPKANDVLIRVHATTVTSADHRIRSLDLPRGFGLFGRPAFGFFGPRKPILGSELAGTVVAVGPQVTRFVVGDRVFAFPGIGLGCHAEFRTMPEDGRVLHMPPNLDFTDAAALAFGGTTALHFLHTVGHTKPGDRVLIIGASGAVGSAAVQLARHAGAHVTAVTSTSNLDMMSELGADDVLDYTVGPYLDGSRTWDIIFDTIGATSFGRSKCALKPGGRLLMAAADLPQLLGAPFVTLGSGKHARGGTTPERREDLETLAGLAADGRFRPHVGRTFRFEAISEAHAHVATGRKRGNVVVTLVD